MWHKLQGEAKLVWLHEFGVCVCVCVYVRVCVCCVGGWWVKKQICKLGGKGCLTREGPSNSVHLGGGPCLLLPVLLPCRRGRADGVV